MQADTITQGPWETSRDAVPEWHTQISVYAPDGTRVATVFGTEANARLIAASPRMLNVLQLVSMTLRGRTFTRMSDEDLADVVDSVIAKAEGVQA